jgi:hypothetical protein
MLEGGYLPFQSYNQNTFMMMGSTTLDDQEYFFNNDYNLYEREDTTTNHFSKPNYYFSEPGTQTPPRSIIKESTQEIEYDVPSPLRVKPNEKIELMIGIDESPTLQATALAWAPSEAALAAANAAKNTALKNPINTDTTTNDAFEIDPFDGSLDDLNNSHSHLFHTMAFMDTDVDNYNEDNESFSGVMGLGLGFDPAENMDYVMMSPTIKSEHDNNLLDLLKLPDFKLSEASDSSSSGVFETQSKLFKTFGSYGSPTWESRSSTTTDMNMENKDNEKMYCS